MRDFRKLEIWEEGMRIAVEVHGLTGGMKSSRRWALMDQMERASLAIPSNIAEGCGRRTSQDTARFMDLAIGSAFELETQLRVAESLELIEDASGLITSLRTLSRKILSYSRHLRS